MLKQLKRIFTGEAMRAGTVECCEAPPGAYTAVLFKEVGSDGRFYFQKRTRKEKIFYGRLAMFGGHREGDETPQQCALRELREELGVDFHEQELIKIAAVNTFDSGCQGAIGQVFLIDEVDPKRILAKNVNAEGRLVRLRASRLAAHWRELTPVTALAVLQYYVYKECKG